MSDLAFENSIHDPRGIVKKYESNPYYHMVGIMLNHAPSHVRLNGVQGNNTDRGFHLGFVGKYKFDDADIPTLIQFLSLRVGLKIP